MARFKFVTLSNAASGRDDAFNTWYENQHIPDVLAIPGFVSCERFKLALGEGLYQYMAIYVVETDEIAKAMDDLRGRVGTERMPFTDAVDKTNSFSGVFATIGVYPIHPDPG